MSRPGSGGNSHRGRGPVAIDERPAGAGDDDEVDVAQAIRFAPRPRSEQVGGLHAVATEQRGEPSREPAGYRSRRSRVLAHRRILPAARRAARAWAAEKASAGAMPGPICFGRGEQPTVTDANLALGRLDTERFLGGSVKLDHERMMHWMEKAKGAIATARISIT